MNLLRWIAVPLAVPLAWLIALALANAGELFGGGGGATGAAQQAPMVTFLLLIGFLQVLLPGLVAPVHTRRAVACMSFGIGCLIVCVLATLSRQAVLLLPALTGFAALVLVFRLWDGEARTAD